MAKTFAKDFTEAREFAQESSVQAMQAASLGVNWMRGLTDQSLNQSRAVLEGYLAAGTTAVDSINRQTSELSRRSIAIAEEALALAFDFAHKLGRVKDPQELLQLQSEYISRQAQLFADQARDAGETMLENANQMTDKAVRGAAATMRRRAA
jgi:hypothetical protein